MSDPYGGLPRREDEDEDDMAGAVPLYRPRSEFDVYPTYMSFRDIVLSMQSLNAHHPVASETSVKRWARRALTRVSVTADSVSVVSNEASQRQEQQQRQPRKKSNSDSSRAMVGDETATLQSTECSPIIEPRSLVNPCPCNGSAKVKPSSVVTTGTRQSSPRRLNERSVIVDNGTGRGDTEDRDKQCYESLSQ